MRPPFVKVAVVTCTALALGACRDALYPGERAAAIEIVSSGGPTVNIGLGVSTMFRVVDAKGQPVAGVTVEFESRSGRYDAYDARTNRDGLASPGLWYPTFVGENTMAARVGSLVEYVTTTGVCQPMSMQLPAVFPPTDMRITGALGDADCTYDPGERCVFCFDEFADIYRFTTTTTRAINLRLGSSASGYVSEVTATLRDAQGEVRGSATSEGMSDGWPLLSLTLAPGTYTIEVRGTDESYTLDLLGCRIAGIPRGSIAGTLDTGDCTRGTSETSYIDRYLVSLVSGTPVTITMTSAEVDAYLEVTVLQSYPDAPNIDMIVASSDNATGTDARVTYACPREFDCTVQVIATSARPGGRGAYTLTVE